MNDVTGCTVSNFLMVSVKLEWRAKMSKMRLVMIIGIISVVTMAAVSIPMAMAKAEDAHGNHGKAKPMTLEKIHSMNLPMASQAIDKAIKAIESGKKETALLELRKAQKMLVVFQMGIGKHVKPKFANVRCPIMGSPINPEKVSKSLIRDHKSQKVAFCCAGCPDQWDKLSDTLKNAKLAKAKAKPTKSPAVHKH